MTTSPSPLLQATAALTEAMQQETALARSGNLHALSAAQEAKSLALTQFNRVWATREPELPPCPEECAALRDLRLAADDSALVLEAVQATLTQFLTGLRKTVASFADAGVYQAAGQATRHIPSVQLNAAI